MNHDLVVLEIDNVDVTYYVKFIVFLFASFADSSKNVRGKVSITMAVSNLETSTYPFPAQ